ncbi:hypothetical protein YIM_32280 [Amycolatopsis sp. YIM 10]|nr:hypothetical protein YIM_32280 [Amycolatopsis sp. YIM 10]
MAAAVSGCSVAPELTGTAVLVHFRAPTSTLTPRPGLFHHASTAHGRRELPAAKRTVTQMVTDDMPFLADSVALDAPPRCSQVHVDAAASRHPPRRVRQRQPSRVVDAHGVRPHHRPGPLAQVRHDRQLSPNGPEPHARSSSSTTSGPASASTGSSPLNRPWRRRRRLAHLVLIHRSIHKMWTSPDVYRANGTRSGWRPSMRSAFRVQLGQHRDRLDLRCVEVVPEDARGPPPGAAFDDFVGRDDEVDAEVVG